MEVELNRSIASKLKAFRKAEQALVNEILKRQRACKHEVVWEVPWKHMEYTASLNPRRMCVACRYEEEGDCYSGGTVWSRHGEEGKPKLPAVLVNVLLAPAISREEFYRMRLPVQVPDYVELDFAE